MRLIAGFLGILSVAWPALAGDVALEAGLARVEITPATSMTMYGYEKRTCGPSNGTHDPLFAKVLVLRTGDSRMAIVTLDLGIFMSDRLRRDVAARLGIPVLLLAASHTHSGPEFLVEETGTATPEGAPYLAEVERKIFSAVADASKAMFPARLSVGRGSLQLAYNRLLPREDGRSRALFDNLERVPYGPVDPEVVVLRVEDAASGAARALIVHYACHSVVLGPTNCKYSADWPGAMQAKVEAEMPGTQCMFVQGGAGDINPLFMGRTGNESDDFVPVKKMGELLADEVLKTAREMKPGASNHQPIRYTSQTLTFRNRWDRDKQVEAVITTVLIDGQIAIAAVPGEPFHKLQAMWKSQAEVDVPLFYGYTYTGGTAWPDYIPDLKSAAHGGYGADMSTHIEPGAGERIMLQHLINLYGLQGMWLDRPGRP
jgi:hypothetical protein